MARHKAFFYQKLSGDGTLSQALLGCQELLVEDTCDSCVGVPS